MNIQLPDFVLAGLYKDSIVLAAEKIAQPGKIQEQITNKKIKDDRDEKPLIKKWFLGDNRKNITILLKDASSVHINDEWLHTLTKLLAACKLNIGDTAIVNHLQQTKTFNELKESLQPQFVFMFDVTTQDIQLPFTFPHYQIQKYSNCTFMTVPVVTLTNDNSEFVKIEKRKLWEKMKLIFNV
ncbi:MAG TPA: hypothetical protein VH396_21815 [Chitinophagaceae bacterium]|jgi:hypothetical protein